MKTDLYAYLAANEYPGRGICVGKAPDGITTMIAYFIMGRSENSRNRVFDPIPGGIRTMAADPAKMKDPHLIIYNPVRTINQTSIVTNGDQTDTICDFIMRDACPGYGFEAALSTRTFEDDAPNFTPRISAAVSHGLGGCKLSILKSDDGNGEAVLRQYFDYPNPVAGEGHFISTYRENGEPLPSFAGEPLTVEIDTNDPKVFAARIWDALNKDNKVSLFVRAITPGKEPVDVIQNRFKVVKPAAKKTGAKKPLAAKKKPVRRR